jgi:hypothetical protein
MVDILFSNRASIAKRVRWVNEDIRAYIVGKR